MDTTSPRPAHPELVEGRCDTNHAMSAVASSSVSSTNSGNAQEEAPEEQRRMDPKLAHPDRPVAKKHEQALRRGSFSSIDELTEAIAYFESTQDHPQKDAKLERLLDLARTRFLPHRKREESFTALLALERTSADARHWPQIHRLLEHVGTYLNIDPTLREKLVDAISPIIDDKAGTIQERDITYEQWRALVNPHVMHEVVPPLPVLPAQEPPLLPPLPPETKQEQVTETPKDQVVTTKKKKKKKKKKSGKKKVQELDPDTLFQTAMKAKKFAQALELLKTHRGKIDVNGKDVGFHPVLSATIGNHEELLKELLAQGASPHTMTATVQPKSGDRIICTALLPAVLNGRLECARLLLAARADPNVVMVSEVRQNVEHALCLAAFSNQETYTPTTRISMLVLLLHHGATATCNRLKIVFRHPTLGWVVDLQHPKLAGLISEHLACAKKISFGNDIISVMADPERLVTSQVWTPLVSLLGPLIVLPDLIHQFAYVVHQNDFIEAEKFLEAHKEVDLNVSSIYYNGLPPLFFAIIMDSTVLCDLLIKHCANTNQMVTLEKEDKTNFQITPLVYALTAGRKESVCRLLNNGADPNLLVAHSPPETTQSPLDCVVDQKDNALLTPQLRADLIRILLLKGATVCSKTISIHNRATHESCIVELTKSEDQERIKEILIADTDATAIMCENDIITLIEK